jgi:hypothetical protein
MKKYFEELAIKEPILALQLVGFLSFILCGVTTGAVFFYSTLPYASALLLDMMPAILWLIWSLWLLFAYSLWNEIQIKKELNKKDGKKN